jgi:tRNA dimethylallyltransferase
VAKQVAPLIVVVGETASGKSALSLELAKKFNGELICADSWTVYKGFDIGTAKPSNLERAMVPHHLLDVADPRGGFSAVIFQQLAQAAIDAIHRRGRLPILVGGTGLYIDSVIYNYGFLSAPPPELREKLNGMPLAEVLELAKSKGLDTSGIDVRNKRRVIRLIENEGALPTRKPLRPNTLILGIQTPRDTLAERITKRVDAMLASGLELEVAKLADEFGWGAEPMKGVGYKEWREYFEGSASLEQVRQRIIKNTLDLAKRQRTWFKRNKSIHWITTPVKQQSILTAVCYNEGMVEQLFGSKTRVKLLQLFYSNPNRSFYVREITRKIDEQINSVRRELANLLNVGIITSDNTDNKLYYEVNQKYEFYIPLQQIFGGGTKRKAKKETVAADSTDDDEYKALGHLDMLIYTGQFTRDESAGVDVLFVGNLNKNAVAKFVAELEEKEGKEIRYTIMSTSDFQYRKTIKDRFVSQLLSAKKQVLVDTDNLLD